jgi:hypothetical protein
LQSKEEAVTAEVRRAVREIHQTLLRLANRPSQSRSIQVTLDVVRQFNFIATADDGPGAFEYDLTHYAIRFRANLVERVIRAATDLSATAMPSDGVARARLSQTAVNLFALHELMHIVQNFPHHADVGLVKAGLGPAAVPMLDSAADAEAAWICAWIECEAAGFASEEEFLGFYANALLLSYLIGAFVFDIKGKPEKMQRSLGLLMLCVLVQAKAGGWLVGGQPYLDWDVRTALFAFDLEKAKSFNAFVFDKVPGLLMAKSHAVTPTLLERIWSGLGEARPQESLEAVAEAFIAVGVLKAPDALDSAAPDADEAGGAAAALPRAGEGRPV